MTPSVFRLSVRLMEEPATLIVVITGNDRNLWYAWFGIHVRKSGSLNLMATLEF